MRKLIRSSTNKQITGVCGGIAEYYALDPTLVRVGAVLITVFTGFFPGIFAYFVLAIIIPSNTGKNLDTDAKQDKT